MSHHVPVPILNLVKVNLINVEQNINVLNKQGEAYIKEFFFT